MRLRLKSPTTRRHLKLTAMLAATAAAIFGVVNLPSSKPQAKAESVSCGMLQDYLKAAQADKDALRASTVNQALKSSGCATPLDEVRPRPRARPLFTPGVIMKA